MHLPHENKLKFDLGWVNLFLLLKAAIRCSLKMLSGMKGSVCKKCYEFSTSAISFALSKKYFLLPIQLRRLFMNYDLHYFFVFVTKRLKSFINKLTHLLKMSYFENIFKMLTVCSASDGRAGINNSFVPCAVWTFKFASGQSFLIVRSCTPHVNVPNAPIFFMSRQDS